MNNLNLFTLYIGFVLIFSKFYNPFTIWFNVLECCLEFKLVHFLLQDFFRCDKICNFLKKEIDLFKKNSNYQNNFLTLNFRTSKAIYN